MKPSIRRRLLLLLTGTVLAAWLATAAFTYFDARHEIGELLDAHLAQSAGLIAAQLEHEFDDEDEGDRKSPRQYKNERKIAFQVWDKRGRLLLRSASAPETRLQSQSEGYGDTVIDGKRWRIFSRWDESRHYLVQVGERYEIRDELAGSVASHLMHPLAVGLPVLALLIWLGVGAGLAPLGNVAREIQRREPDNLAHLDEGNAPREVVPLIAAINALFDRLRNSLEQERRFTADAAHELRTPLAAVKTQAQVALGARSDVDRTHALSSVVSGTDRAARLVEQLLVLARLDPQTTLPQGQTVSLHELAARCIAEVAPAAAAKNVEMSLSPGAEANVAGDAILLGVLLRNLLDNAVRYTPAGGEVAVDLSRTQDAVLLTVSDSGPGIPEAERTQVLDRFYRVLGSGEEGSGLGLSIVKRIADLHRARVSLGAGPAGRGLRVDVAFPADPR
ncbi:MAG: sensor histidine kinase N-terminal domain-containing protein [Rhodocyclaceae bacterium]|nr:sensor histidine kinase N-terminal domain-containing protein [Rhodocyclaceae bacterium]MCP5297060.1 sensor histidine kinase N-terminal domain-containing protein [Zoogloeaceae bacterium]PKO68103.1 MAG: two-component sensor histidine kinase [Betaproteobacteria bacterium HGW-Betaproteobacteria-14]MBX3676855.1 sensor histidine kinase N-terminal domain-containing protein [Rhodocyclaceae bacterium]MCB1893207.1 sensor histidine kinase N-terminal domain-containing protein [Rhodocyclaceae bacterium]